MENRSETMRRQAAAEQQAARARQEEYMSLAEGVGIVPEQFRNRGYEKLDFGPGEGGLGDLTLGVKAKQAGPAQDDRVTAFLAGVAAGADPEKLAGQLLAGQAGESTTSRRARRGEKEATA